MQARPSLSAARQCGAGGTRDGSARQGGQGEGLARDHGAGEAHAGQTPRAHRSRRLLGRLWAQRHSRRCARCVTISALLVRDLPGLRRRGPGQLLNHIGARLGPCFPGASRGGLAAGAAVGSCGDEPLPLRTRLGPSRLGQVHNMTLQLFDSWRQFVRVHMIHIVCSVSLSARSVQLVGAHAHPVNARPGRAAVSKTARGSRGDQARHR